MAGIDHHRKPFDSATQTKLSLYGGYVAEWLPVFLNFPNMDPVVNIFDFFAGPGVDIDGNLGSPMIALNKIIDALEGRYRQANPQIYLYLNEKSKKKFALLKKMQVPERWQKNVHLIFTNEDFREIFPKWVKLMQTPGVANLVFIDQNGVKQVSSERFQKLIEIPYTDILFFISSSYISRFRNHPMFTKHLPLHKIDKSTLTYANAHKKVVELYKEMIPENRRENYFLGDFSLKKPCGAIYGLIFGTSHILGLDKFLNLCWRIDSIRGEANYETDKIDWMRPSLFAEDNIPTKWKVFEENLRRGILEEKMKTNLEIYKFSLINGFPAKHTRGIIANFIKNKELPQQHLSISYDAWRDEKVQFVKV